MNVYTEPQVLEFIVENIRKLRRSGVTHGRHIENLEQFFAQKYAYDLDQYDRAPNDKDFTTFLQSVEGKKNLPRKFQDPDIVKEICDYIEK
ncbi:MAG: hypothetical protein ABJO27_07350 [Pseudoruegeria sp.]